MTDVFTVVPEFFEGCDELRGEFDAHFARPYEQTDRHFNWNYWHVPHLYTYLRAFPSAVFSPAVLERFMTRLATWSATVLGLTAVTQPTLSLYVHGCAQEPHNDATNGSRGYVFSLTRWSEAFEGGETLIFDRLADYDRTEAMTRADAGFCQRVPPRYNQLLTFDDRIVHGVARVQGSLDPRRGRVVMHGHLRPGPPLTTGALAAADGADVVGRAHPALARRLASYGDCHGVVALRLTLGKAGTVRRAQVLSDSLRSTSRTDDDTPAVKREVVAWARGLRFPTGPATFTFPVELA